MTHSPSLAILALTVVTVIPGLAAADEGPGPWWTPRMRSKETVGNETQGRAVESSTAPAPSAPASTPPAGPPAAVLPDPSLKNTIELVRRSAIGKEPNAVAYLDLMAAGGATAAQVNDFAAYLAKRGMTKVAVSFQEYALRIDPQNATLWQNLGTIQRTNREFDSAVTAFKKAIDIDPINALAHYNLGAVYDAQGHYDDAVEEYRRALVLDPGLADPRKNPQVVNNENLLAVKLQIYHDQAGSLGLPLLQMQKPSPPPKTTPDKP